MTRTTLAPCPSSTPYVVAIIILILLLLGLAAWTAYSLWIKKPTPATPVPAPVPAPQPVTASQPVRQTGFVIYGNPNGMSRPQIGPNNALVQSGTNLILGTPQDPRSEWRVVDSKLQNVSSGQYLVVSPSGTIGFSPNQAAATRVSLKTDGVTVIGTSGLNQGVGGLTVLSDGRVVAQTAGPRPDSRMAWLVVAAPQ